MKKFLLILLFTVIAGCTWINTVEDLKLLHESENIKLNARFYMIYPKNVSQNNDTHPALNDNITHCAEVASVFYNKFHQHLGSLFVTQTPLTLNEGFKQAKLRQDMYLITMDIHEWNDVFYMSCGDERVHSQERDTSHYDSFDITVRIYDVQTKKLLNEQRLKNSGCPVVLLGFIPLGKMGPDMRFDTMLELWLKILNQD